MAHPLATSGGPVLCHEPHWQRGCSLGVPYGMNPALCFARWVAAGRCDGWRRGAAMGGGGALRGWRRGAASHRLTWLVGITIYIGGFLMRLIHRRRGLAAMAALVLAGGALLASGTASAAPGNHGTIKLDGVTFDDYPNNEPHVGCVFQLDFYGYDQGPYNARVAFVVKPPTGKNIPLLNDTVFIGEDPAGGGTDLDASRTYAIEALLLAFMATRSRVTT